MIVCIFINTSLQCTPANTGTTTAKMSSFFGAKPKAAPAPASASEAPIVSRALPWVEKYRPKNMADISSHEDIVKSLANAVKSGQVPHLLFYGPPGTGKTSTILAVARELYGPELMKTRIMELNASDERGIGVIREKVKGFAMTSVGASTTAAPFKLIILDEADSLTADAQAALRRTIETYSKVTRFCILCNYVSRIIEPLASRCSKFRFKPLESSTMIARLVHIRDSERVTASTEALDEVLKVSGGDMRKAITFLQSAAALHGNVITPEDVIEISGILPDKEVNNMVDSIKSGSFEACRRSAQSITYAGYGMATVLDKLLTKLISDASITAPAKAIISEHMAMSEKRLLDGADEELQLLDLLLVACRAINGTKIESDRIRPIII